MRWDPFNSVVGNTTYWIECHSQFIDRSDHSRRMDDSVLRVQVFHQNVSGSHHERYSLFSHGYLPMSHRDDSENRSIYSGMQRFCSIDPYTKKMSLCRRSWREFSIWTDWWVEFIVEIDWLETSTRSSTLPNRMPLLDFESDWSFSD